MRHATLVALAALMIVAESHAQRGAPGEVGQVNVGGTPRISAADAARPVPRMPDGKPDLTGPWVGGGSNVVI